jgi:hypothetical protein
MISVSIRTKFPTVVISWPHYHTFLDTISIEFAVTNSSIDCHVSITAVFTYWVCCKANSSSIICCQLVLRFIQVTHDVCRGRHSMFCWVLPGFNQMAVTMDAGMSWCDEILRNYLKQWCFFCTVHLSGGTKHFISWKLSELLHCGRSEQQHAVQ